MEDEAVDSAETMQTTLHDMLEKTRRLYQVRRACLGCAFIVLDNIF